MSSSTGMSSCCLSGHIHSGSPVGKEETIDGIPTYVSPSKDGQKAKTVVIFCDIFGWKLNNTRLLADEYAKNGFEVYLPELCEGVPEDFLNTVEPPKKTRDQLSTVDKATATAKVGATLGPFLIKHREGITKPLIEKFLTAVKQIPGTNKVGALGFCWGGRYAILEAAGGVDAAYACHPSLVSTPADFDGVKKPLSIALGDQDSLVPQSEIDKIQDLFKTKTDCPLEVKVYEDQVHGFALRGDWSSEKDKKAMDDALKQGVTWFNKYLA